MEAESYLTVLLISFDPENRPFLQWNNCIERVKVKLKV
jgi:hypothetical protein